jgi:hypothetical protein
MGFVPMAAFHASALGWRRLSASNPTPNRVLLRGESAIMVVIRVPPRESFIFGNLRHLGRPSIPKVAIFYDRALFQY